MPQKGTKGTKQINRYFLLCFLCLFVATPCFAQSRMRVADVVRVMSVADAQISPNGQWVVYTVSSVEEDKNVSTLWLARSGLDSYPVAAPTPPRRPSPEV